MVERGGGGGRVKGFMKEGGVECGREGGVWGEDEGSFAPVHFVGRST